MTLRRKAPRAKPRWIGLVGAVAGLLLLVVGATLAVHDLDFQLDGNITSTPDSTIGTFGNGTQETDWEDLFDANGDETGLPAGFTATGFNRDFRVNPGCVLTGTGTFCTADQSTFATGSKDTLPITPGWQCNFDNNVNSKIDIMNSYAASYDTGTEEILYFAMERNTNTGTANVGFWFLQDDDVGCNSTGGSAAFTGDHVDGDLLVVSEFTNGGVINTILVYEWEGGADGALNPNPVAGGEGPGVDCTTVTGLDSVCGEVNTATVTTPWKTANKQDGVSNSLRISEFFEAGLNLTEEGLGGRCFNTFIATTRSSTSLTATIFDFSRGVLGQCTSDTTTTPQTAAGATIPAAGISIGTTARLDVRDHAEIDVTGVDAFGGTVTFFLCGPNVGATANCQTGGVQIGDPVAVTGASGEASVNSPTATLTSVGKYCWRAEYSGDASLGVPDSSDPDNATHQGECFTVNAVQPTLTTQASADTVLGQAITDTASLTGTALQPGTDGDGPGGTINATAATQMPAGGQITFNVRGPDNCNASGLTVTGSPVTVSGDNASYGPVSATPTAVGKYTFVAAYINPTTNTLAAGPSSCPPGLNDGDEEVNVGGTTAVTTTQQWTPNDTANITSSAGTTLAGTVTFKLFDNGTCAGTTPVLTITKNVVTDAEAGGTANNRTVKTNQTAYIVTAANDGVAWSWLVSYDDNALPDSVATCETTTPAFTLNP